MSRFVHCLPLAGEGMADKMDYASAGVDIDLEGSAVASLISSLSKSVRPVSYTHLTLPTIYSV